ncbi:MAG: sigma-70 family RNA polymerase sigma factor [Gemmatimonadaceae bacterium]
MDAVAPIELSQLLSALDSTSQEAAWEDLIGRHTRLLLALSRTFSGGHDEVMERYAYILEKLREDNFRRLRTFDANSGVRFSTWLTVAARRLCLDQLRARYGRLRPGTHSAAPDSLRNIRRALADELGPDIDIEILPDEDSPSAIAQTVLNERDRALGGALTQLDSRERLLVALRFEDDLSAASIARIVGAPTPFHIYRQLNGVLEKLRRLLRSRGIEGVDG